MNKKLGFIMVGFMMLSISGVARAEINPEQKAGLIQERQAIKAERQATRTEIKTQREVLKKEMEAKRETLKKEIQTKKEEFKKEVKAKKEEFKKEAEQKKEEFRGRAQTMISKEFEIAVRNLETLQTRVASRVAKEKATGKDTTLEETALANSKTKLDAAKLKIAEVKALIPADGTKITADVFEKIKLGARDAKDLLKGAHQELVNAITGLKGQPEQENQTQN